MVEEHGSITRETIAVLEIGRVTRHHGLRGELVVQLTTTELARVEPGSVLFAGERPLVVREARHHRKHWVVRFDGVDSREAADELRGATLHAEPIQDDDLDSLWVHELIGAEVIDLEGVSRGRVESVQANPASDVLVLDSGALVPLTFAVGWDLRGERLRIDPPAGLFEI
jgi:16S rRNA processing protein RimM